jgi:hypothetical protein
MRHKTIALLPSEMRIAAVPGTRGWGAALICCFFWEGTNQCAEKSTIMGMIPDRSIWSPYSHF